MKKFMYFIVGSLILIISFGFLIRNTEIIQSWGEKSSFELTDMQEDNIKLNINGKDIKLNNKIFLTENRYYIPLNEIVKASGGTIKNIKNSISINLFNKEIVINKNNWTINNEKIKLKKKIVNYKKNIYISLFDFTNIFDLESRWSFNDKTIKIYKAEKDNSIKKYSGDGKQEGAIRFEDVSIEGNGTLKESQYLETLRFIGKNLYERDMPYFIAWIPRYINKEKNVDTDPSKENSFPLAELVYTLDYLSSKNAYIGLHGYTHQRGDEVSGEGEEFGKNYPSIEELNSRVKKALEIANYLDIDISFFEAPHYLITVKQNEELEKSFKYIFNNYNCEVHLDNQRNIVKSPTGNDSYYIPTPLYYVEDSTGDSMIKKIKRFPSKDFAGLFYHPFIEVDYINFTEDENGVPKVAYKEKSILMKIIDALEEKNIKLIRLN